MHNICASESLFTLNVIARARFIGSISFLNFVQTEIHDIEFVKQNLYKSKCNKQVNCLI